MDLPDSLLTLALAGGAAAVAVLAIGSAYVAVRAGRRRRRHRRPGGAEGPRCPGCLSHNVHRSRVRWWDLPRLLLLQRPWRCGHCAERHWRFAGR